MENEEIKTKVQKTYRAWTSGLIISLLGLALFWLAFNLDTNFFERLILLLLGIIFQIPLGYFKIYKTLIGKD